MSVTVAGTKSRAEKGIGDDLERPFVLSMRREGLDLTLLSVSAQDHTNGGGTDVSKLWCRGAAYHGTMVELRLGAVPAVRNVVSDEMLESEVVSPRLPLGNLSSVAGGLSLILTLGMSRDARDGVC